MRVVYHPGFSSDLRQFEAQYSQVSDGLALRFRDEVLQALARIKEAPTSAGHFLATASMKTGIRRRNLRSFPFFILYGFSGQEIFIGSIVASRSDPLTWLSRFQF